MQISVFLLICGISYLCADNCMAEKCFGDESDQCWECLSGYLWKNGICTFVGKREIPGYVRGCVECGYNNYADSANLCHSCDFNATVCDGNEDYLCKDTFEVSPAIKKCICVNGTFSVLLKKCICQTPETYTDANGVCQTCTKDTICMRGCTPKCPKGFYKSGCQCLPCGYMCLECVGPQSCYVPPEPCDPTVTNCSNDQSNGTNGTNGTDSKCKPPFEWVVPTNSCLCPCYSKEMNGECFCNDGYYMVDYVCYPKKDCPLGQYFKESLNSCLCIDPAMTYVQGQCIKTDTCPPGFTYDKVNRWCFVDPTKQCPSNFVLDPVSSLCICDSTHIYLNGKCESIICYGGQIISNKQCTCPIPGQQLNYANVCAVLGDRDCRSDMSLVSNLCTCKKVGTQYYINNFIQGKCLPALDVNCPVANQIINKNYLCSCKPGFMLTNYQCVLISSKNCPDPAMQVFANANKCVCKCRDGYQQNGNVCKACSSTEVYYNGMCYAAAIFVCPTGTILRGSKCVLI